MKKKIYLLSALALLLSVSSCGKSACDCLKEAQEISMEAMKDPANAADYTSELEKLQEDCKGYTAEDLKDCK